MSDMDWAIEAASQIWCEPKNSHKVMDSDLAASFVAALRKAKADGLRQAIEIILAFETREASTTLELLQKLTRTPVELIRAEIDKLTNP